MGHDMEIPDSVEVGLAYFTASILMVLFLKNLMAERKRQQKHQHEPAGWSDVSRSQIVNWRRTFRLLGDATEATANLASRISVVVILILTLIYGIAVPFVVPFSDWWPALGLGVLGASVVYAIVHKVTE